MADGKCVGRCEVSDDSVGNDESDGIVGMDIDGSGMAENVAAVGRYDVKVII